MKISEEIDLFAAQQRAARIAARAEIRDVRLFRSAVDLDKFPAEGAHLKWSLDTDVAVELEEDASAFVLRASYELTISEASTAVPDQRDGNAKKDDAEAPKVLDIQFEFAALFSLEMREGDASIDDSELQAYAVTTGQFAVYPFAREYIFDVTGRVGLPPLTVGVLQLPTRPES